MNMRLFTVLSAVSVLGLVACSTETSGGGGAGGGTGGGGTTTSSSTTSNGGTGGQGGGTGGAGGGGTCATCLDYLSDPAVNAEDLCTDNGPPSSADILAALEACTCVDACATDCGDNACQGLDATTACQDCVIANCSNEYGDCSNDSI